MEIQKIAKMVHNTAIDKGLWSDFKPAKMVHNTAIDKGLWSDFKPAEMVHNTAIDKGLWSDFKPAEMAGPEGRAFWICQKLLLVHTELSEACEALRREDQANFAEEIADAVIRLLDLAEGLEIDIEIEIMTKNIANAARPERHGKLF